MHLHSSIIILYPNNHRKHTVHRKWMCAAFRIFIWMQLTHVYREKDRVHMYTAEMSSNRCRMHAHIYIVMICFIL